MEDTRLVVESEPLMFNIDAPLNESLRLGLDFVWRNGEVMRKERREKGALSLMHLVVQISV